MPASFRVGEVVRNKIPAPGAGARVWVCRTIRHTKSWPIPEHQHAPWWGIPPDLQSATRSAVVEVSGRRGPMEPTASFGSWLRQRRKALDLTEEALGRRVGCA